MDELQNIRELLEPCRKIVASDTLRQRISKMTATNHHKNVRRHWLWGGTSAAACMTIILGSILLQKNSTTSLNKTDCIVYSDGMLVIGNNAKSIAENDVAKMEKFMQTVAAQQATEEAKVYQFMNHKNTQKR